MGPAALSKTPQGLQRASRESGATADQLTASDSSTQLTPKNAVSFASLTHQCSQRVSKEHVGGTLYGMGTGRGTKCVCHC